MRGYDPNNEHTIIAKVAGKDDMQPHLHEPKLNPTAAQIAAQGYETIVSAASAAPYSKERDTTYETDDGYGYPYLSR